MSLFWTIIAAFFFIEIAIPVIGIVIGIILWIIESLIE